MVRRFDMRQYGLMPFRRYIVSNKKTGQIYGYYYIGALGALRAETPYDNRYVNEIKDSIDDCEFVEVTQGGSIK